MRLRIAIAALVLAVLACDSTQVTSTPYDVQGTSGALNSTYVMWSTQTAVANTPTATSVPASRMPAPTVWYPVEVTACPEDAICEVGTAINWPSPTPLTTPGTPGVVVTPLGGTDAR